MKVAFTGNRPDIAKHDSSVTHQNCASDYREFQARESSSSSIAQIIDQSNTLTVDEDALVDSMRCLYWLAHHEVPNSLFCPLLNVCVLLGNTTLPLLNKAKNLNYRSEQIKAEFLTCIGSCIRRAVNVPVDRKFEQVSVLFHCLDSRLSSRVDMYTLVWCPAMCFY